MALGADLAKRILKDFEKKRNESPGLKRLRRALEAGTATYKEADQYAVALGDMLARSFKESIKQDELPGGRLDLATAAAVIRPPLETDHNIIAEYAAEVQKLLNESAGLGLNAVVPEVDQNRIQGLIDRVGSAPDFDSISWILGEPVRNYSQNVVDESVRLNVEAQSKSGLSPKIIRTAEPPGTRTIKRGKKTYTYQVPCKWCAGLAGTYDYEKVKATGSDVYRRHEGCRCIVEYSPDGVRRQNVHTKTWATPEEIAQRKAIQPPTVDKEAIKEQADRPRIFNALAADNVKYNPLGTLPPGTTTDEIIARLGGADKTKGSCQSLAFAFLGNLAGYDVLDFRGGASLDVFSRASFVKTLLELPGVIGYTNKNYNEFTAVGEILKNCIEGKYYTLSVAKHAAVIQKTGDTLYYLELQSANYNGWHELTTTELRTRFGCRKSQTFYGTKLEGEAVLFDADSLINSPDFIELLGYINTEESKQKKGAGGGIK